jgi:hypothetical protein
MNYKVKKAVKAFFSIKPVRDKNTSTKTAVLLTIGIFLTQLGDVLTTRIGLMVGASEANPFMKSVVESPDTFLTIKLLAASLMSWFFWKRPFGALGLIIFYLLIIINNLLAIYVRI